MFSFVLYSFVFIELNLNKKIFHSGIKNKSSVCVEGKVIKTPKHVNGVEMVCENLNVIGTVNPKVCCVYLNEYLYDSYFKC